MSDLATEERLVYILNGKLITTNFDSDLFAIDDSNLIALKLIDRKT